MAAPPDLTLDFCGLHFNTPLVLLSGCAGFGDEYTRVVGYDHHAVGAVCLKGTTLNPRTGNPSHRAAETASGMLNAVGLQNPGVHAVVQELLPKLDFSATCYIANVAGATVQEFVEVCKVFDDSPVHAIELNVSCPNVKDGGLGFGNDPVASARVVEACRKITDKPLITKLSPNQSDIADNARHCIEAGSNAFAAINTVTGMSIDVRSQRPVLGNLQGGLSGPAIKPIALWRVHEVYQVCKPHGIPIIGQGGVSCATDVIEFLLAGATAVGVGTGLFYDPLVCTAINRELCSYMQDLQLTAVGELTGALQG